jgi:hypothetical protein
MGMRALYLLIACMAVALSSCGGGDPEEDLPEARQSGANHGAR